MKEVGVIPRDVFKRDNTVPRFSLDSHYLARIFNEYFARSIVPKHITSSEPLHMNQSADWKKCLGLDVLDERTTKSVASAGLLLRYGICYLELNTR